MGRRRRLWSLILQTSLALGLASASLQAQTPTDAKETNRHVVTVNELNQDAAGPAQQRAADEAAVRDLLNTEAGQKALNAAHLDYAKVDKAVTELSDADLARIADRSRDAQREFAAGGIGMTLLIAIILIVVLAVVLKLVF